MTESGLFFVYFSSFQTQILHKLQASAKLELGAEDEHVDHLTTTTAQVKYPFTTCLHFAILTGLGATKQKFLLLFWRSNFAADAWQCQVPQGDLLTYWREDNTTSQLQQTTNSSYTITKRG